MSRHFMELYTERELHGLSLCVGLDPNTDSHDPKGQRTAFLQRIERSWNPAEQMFRLCVGVIEDTADIAMVFKLNIAFFEAIPDGQGIKALKKLVRYLHEHYPHIPVIIDAKRADIGATNAGYASFIFDELQADAVTVNPYFGAEALEPFLEREEKGIIALVRTSNPGADEFQSRSVRLTPSEMEDLGRYNRDDVTHAPLYQVVARSIATRWNERGNMCVVAGATQARDVAVTRSIIGVSMPMLLPGFGTQGATVGDVVPLAKGGSNGHVMCNSSSAIMFSDDPGQAALDMHDEILAAKRLPAPTMR